MIHPRSASEANRKKNRCIAYRSNPQKEGPHLCSWYESSSSGNDRGGCETCGCMAQAELKNTRHLAKQTQSSQSSQGKTKRCTKNTAQLRLIHGPFTPRASRAVKGG